MGRYTRSDLEMRSEATAMELEFEGAHEVNAYLAHLRRRLKTSGEQDEVPVPETMDRATHRAILFMRAARQGRQHQTSQMWQALVDACLLQGEIVVGALLVVLMIRQWQARKTLLQLQETVSPLPHEDLATDIQSGEPLSVRTVATESDIPSPVAAYNALSLSSRSAAIADLVAQSMSDDAFDQRDLASQDPFHPKPKIPPRQTIPNHSYDISSSHIIPNPFAPPGRLILRAVVQSVIYPADGSNAVDLFPQPEHVNPRYPRPELGRSIEAFEILARSAAEDEWERVSEGLIKAMVEFPKDVSAIPFLCNHDMETERKQNEVIVQATHDRLHSIVTRFAETHPTSLLPSDWNNLLWAAYYGLRSRDAADALLDAMESNGVVIDDNILATMLTGLTYLEDWPAAEQILRKILDTYESDPNAVDPRIPLLLYSTMAHQAASDVGLEYLDKANHLDAKLRTYKRLVTTQFVPKGVPVLLNAVLKYYGAANLSSVVRRHLDAILVFHYMDQPRDGVLALATTFGPEFYHLLLLHLDEGQRLQNIGLAERVWALARLTEIQSWRTSLRRMHGRYQHGRHDHNIEEGDVPLPKERTQSWFRSLKSYKALYSIFSNARLTKAGSVRPGVWCAEYPLDAATAFKFERNMYDGLPPADMARKRALELHEGFLSAFDLNQGILSELWRRLRTSDPDVVIPDTGDLTMATLVKLVPEPDAEYWRWVMHDAAVLGEHDLVPMLHNDVAEVALVREGAHVMKLVPFCGDEDAAVEGVAGDMRDRGWTLRRQLPLTSAEQEIPISEADVSPPDCDDNRVST